MGLTVGLIGCLLHEAKAAAFSGKLGTLGRQDVVGRRDQIASAFERAGVPPITPLRNQLNANPVGDLELAKALGFAALESLDVSSYEKATIALDLNSQTTPDNLHDRYDCIIDSGTIEHVFDVPASLRHVHRMLKVGGRAIFFTPSNNALEHGFYQISPTLYHDYFTANNYKINHIYLLRRRHDLYSDFEAFIYKPEDNYFWELNAIDDRMYLLWASVTKLEQSTCDVVPNQHRYTTVQWLQTADIELGPFQKILGMTTQPLLTAVIWRIRMLLKGATAMRIARNFRAHASKPYSFKIWGGA